MTMKPERQVNNEEQPPLTRSVVEVLMERDARPESPVLSVYLDTDQSDPINVQRAFEVVFKNMLKNVEPPAEKSKQQELRDDADAALRFLEDYRDTRRGLVMFCDTSEGLFWIRELAVRVPNILRWHEKPYVRPLFELIDEHERYGVVLTDRSKARLFTIFLGEIEEYKEEVGQADVKHVKSPGTDHALSQMQIQRKADLHARWHLKDVSKIMSRLALKRGFDRLILGGTAETTNELFGLLPKSLRARVVSKIALPVEANTEQVLEETLKIETEIERQREVTLVDSLITAARKKEKAVVGLEDTLFALQEWRVWQLVFTDGFNATGGECTNCHALLASADGPCTYCGKPVRTIDDLIQAAVERVMDLDGKIEQVQGPAAQRLKEVGSCGAVLHY